ncbi:MAG: ImmA/IrrE family metallo-endopeptidase [Leptospirales bacterium]
MMDYKIKPIHNEKDYERTLDRINILIDNNKGREDELEILSILVEKFENEKYPINAPDPIEAIKFRMDQEGLTQKDLIPFMGSRSKVSEILSGKRELTLKMIRALHQHFGISAEVLLKEHSYNSLENFKEIKFEKFPLIEMQKNGAFHSFNTNNLKDRAEEAIRYLIDRIDGPDAIPDGLFRKTTSSRINARIDYYALQGWSLHLLAEANHTKEIKPFIPKNINDSFLKGLVGLSTMHNGPKLAIEYLANYGIILKYLPHLKSTFLDGAAFKTNKGRPVIGLTLRYDRVDNFWFTLLHEIAHILLHLDNGGFIVDDMSLRGSESDNNKEKEADIYAEKALLPEDFDLHTKTDLSKHELINYAANQNVHPAIVAGRIQYKLNNFRIFSGLVGQGEVKKCFSSF